MTWTFPIHDDYWLFYLYGLIWTPTLLYIAYKVFKQL